MWKDLDILANSTENNNQNIGPTLPHQFLDHPTKPPTITPFIKNIEYSSPTDNNSQLKFLINSTGFLDPYYFFLEIDIINNSSKNIYVEKNYFSLIKKLTISTNGNVLEEIDNFDYISDILFDLNLSPDRYDSFSQFGFYSKIPTQLKAANEAIGEINGHPDNVKKHIVDGTKTFLPPLQTNKIMIPIPSRYFGCGQDFNNYKFIPLERLPNLEIEIRMNKDCFSLSGLSQLAPGTLTRNTLKSGIDFKNARLLTRQMYFDSSALEYVKKYYRGDLILENVQYSVGACKRVNVSSELQEMILEHKQSLKKLYICFYTNAYANNTQCSKYFRIHMGCESMQARCGDEYFPDLPVKGKCDSNVGMQNNSRFLNHLYNSHYITISNQMANAINPKNFSLKLPENDVNTTQIAGAITMDYAENFFNNYTNTGKALFCFDFESIPFSGMNFRNGVDTRFNRPIFVNFKFDANKVGSYLAGNVTEILFTPILEYDSILKIGENGVIVKEF